MFLKNRASAISVVIMKSAFASGLPLLAILSKAGRLHMVEITKKIFSRPIQFIYSRLDRSRASDREKTKSLCCLS